MVVVLRLLGWLEGRLWWLIGEGVELGLRWWLIRRGWLLWVGEGIELGLRWWLIRCGWLRRWCFAVDVRLKCVEAGFEAVGDVIVELEVGGVEFVHGILNGLEHWFCGFWFGSGDHCWLWWCFAEECCDLDFEFGMVRCIVLEVGGLDEGSE